MELPGAQFVGKTVTAAAMIARRGVTTLVPVHRRDWWISGASACSHFSRWIHTTSAQSVAARRNLRIGLTSPCCSRGTRWPRGALLRNYGPRLRASTPSAGCPRCDALAPVALVVTIRGLRS
ncbi:hypothetical protein EVC45_39730 [Paraburkholderia sp. UYCP14C]|nr:hypothetical protein EVC45_39730 [Paraburkholderia sp. UYCP14C]